VGAGAAAGFRKAGVGDEGQNCFARRTVKEKDAAAILGKAVEARINLRGVDPLHVGIALDGQLVRGARNGAGEFGHVPLDMDGPLCGCGLRGCWETYVSVGATVARYLGRSASWPESSRPSTTVPEIVARAREGEARAIAVLEQTGEYLGRGLSIVIKAVQPSRIYMSGEITDGWDLVLPSLRRVLRELTLVAEDADTEIVVVPAADQPRLRGAAALVTSPAFAAPVVA